MDALDWMIVGELQENLPPGENPWQALACRLGISEDDVVARLKGAEGVVGPRGSAPS